MLLKCPQELSLPPHVQVRVREVVAVALRADDVHLLQQCGPRDARRARDQLRLTAPRVVN